MIEFLNEALMGKPVWVWLLFIGVVIALLVIDLGLIHRKSKVIGASESLLMSAFYITIALLFGVWIWFSIGPQSAIEYMTGFMVEKTLALDNVFIISLIFTSLAVPAAFQHRVLFWGILGVIVLRAMMIGVGATLVAEFYWILYVFAVFLIVTGIKMYVVGEKRQDIESHPALRLMRKTMRITPKLHAEKFFVRQPHPVTGKAVLWATPLFVALVMVEIVDLIFAIDSVPAIFAITTDPFVVYTSNIFAILGLRALYFALATIIERFAYLKQALAMVLVFIGSKIFVADLAGWEKFPVGLSLGVTAGLIGAGVIYSLYKTREARPAARV